MSRVNLGEILRMLYPDEFRVGLVRAQQDNEKDGPYIAVWPDELGKKPDADALIATHEAEYLSRREAAREQAEREDEARALLIDEKVLETLREAKTRTKGVV